MLITQWNEEDRDYCMLIDSHAHLDMDDFAADRDPVIKRAVQGGVARIVTIGIDLASSKKAIEIADYTYLFEDGEIVLKGGKNILKHSKIKNVYLGGR